MSNGAEKQKASSGPSSRMPCSVNLLTETRQPSTLLPVLVPALRVLSSFSLQIFSRPASSSHMRPIFRTHLEPSCMALIQSGRYGEVLRHPSSVPASDLRCTLACSIR